MNKIVFYNELIPEDTIIKSILDYKWVYSPPLWFLTISRPGNFSKYLQSPITRLPPPHTQEQVVWCCRIYVEDTKFN